MDLTCLNNHKIRLGCKFANLSADYADSLYRGSNCAIKIRKKLILADMIYGIFSSIDEDDDCLTNKEVENIVSYLNKLFNKDECR